MLSSRRNCSTSTASGTNARCTCAVSIAATGGGNFKRGGLHVEKSGEARIVGLTGNRHVDLESADDIANGGGQSFDQPKVDRARSNGNIDRLLRASAREEIHRNRSTSRQPHAGALIETYITTIPSPVQRPEPSSDWNENLRTPPSAILNVALMPGSFSVPAIVTVPFSRPR